MLSHQLEELGAQIWLSIDVGMSNLGFVAAIVGRDFQVADILFAEKCNIKELQHNTVPLKECHLHHSADAVDRVEHFLQEYREYFDAASRVIIERQPPTGLVHVEQLLYSACRDKAVLQHPSQMHKHFDIRDLDYDQRKVQTEKIAENLFVHIGNQKILESFQSGSLERRHDISDAVCLMLCVCAREKSARREAEEKLELQRKQKKFAEEVCQAMAWPSRVGISDIFSQFRYTPS